MEATGLDMTKNEIDKKLVEVLVTIWLEHFMNKPHDLCSDDAGFLLAAHVERAKKELYGSK